MSKRRRLDSPDQYGTGTWEQQQAPQPSLYGPPALTHASSFGSSHATAEYAPNALSKPYDNAGTGLPSLNDSSTAHASTQWHGSGSSSYPDVSAYSQQPYFFGQTDPSTYNSPWPPADGATSTYGPQNSNYSIAATSEVMPYFPPQRAAETSDSGLENNAPASLHRYQDVESSHQYSYSQSSNGQQQQLHHHNNEARPPSALYLEDASMHLKVQSLSVLENLVSSPPRTQHL